jgi:hypothetical protein
MYWREKPGVDEEAVEIREIVISLSLVNYVSRSFKYYNRLLSACNGNLCGLSNDAATVNESMAHLQRTA